MTIARTGGATSVYIVDDADLKVNGGQYRLQDGGAIPVHSNRAGPIGRRPIRGGNAIPVYIVNRNQLSGPGQKFKLKKGHPRHITSIIGDARGVKGGTAIPVYPATYADKLLLTQPANLIAYWPLWETAGLVAEDISGNGLHGTYTGVTLGQPGIGDGRTSPFFDGVNDFVDIYSATLNSVFNGLEGTVNVWSRVTNVGVWTDGISRDILSLYVDLNNSLIINKNAAANELRHRFEEGGIVRVQTTGGITSTDWIVLTITWSAVNNQVIHYINGAPTGAIDLCAGTWVGNLDPTRVLIGAATQAPINVWDGYLAHCAVWTTPLTGPQIADLATV